MTALELEMTAPPQRRLRHLSRILRRVTWCVLGAVLLVVLFSSFLPFDDPDKQRLLGRLKPPVWQKGGSWGRVLGTDTLGRDLFVRVIDGGRLTLLLAGGAVLLAALVGTLLGIAAGYRGGVTDWIISRVIEAQLALPFILIAITVITTRGRTPTVMIFVLASIGWAQFARLVRVEAMTLRAMPFMVALKANGVPRRAIILRHMLPNVLPTVGVVAALQVATAILAESSLSFLGLGISHGTTWGAMMASGREYLRSAWFAVGIPGIAVSVTVISINIGADKLRSRLDPTLRSR